MQRDEHKMKPMELLQKAELLVTHSTMQYADDERYGSDWVMSFTGDDGYPNASMISAAKADGFHWIAFCTGICANKTLRAKRDPRSCVYLFDKESFTGISLMGKVEVSTDPVLKKQVWYDDLGDYFNGCMDENLCVLLFKPEKYNIFIENTTIRGTFSEQE